MRTRSQRVWWLALLLLVAVAAFGCRGGGEASAGVTRLPVVLGVGLQTPSSTPSSGATSGVAEETAASEEEELDELEEFVPSEEVSADRAVSFPVDI